MSQFQGFRLTRKVDISDNERCEKQLINVILKALLGGYVTPIEKALQALDEHCFILHVPHVSGVEHWLDFVPKRDLPIQVHMLC